MDDLNPKAWREYQCTVFTAVANIIMVTQTQLTYYTGLIFREQLDKKDGILWDNLIDLEVRFLASS